MNTNYKSLLSEVCDAVLGFLRINDLEVSNKDYRITLREVKDARDSEICLQEVGGQPYPVTLKQLAALRIQPVGKSLTAKYLDEFKSDANAVIFQDWLKETMKTGDIQIENLKFQVVSTLMIKNDHVSTPNTPVYQDICYEGVGAYRIATRSLVEELKKISKTPYELREYRYGIADLRRKLYSTPVIAGKGIEANIVRIPVFQVR
jgi:hypothetical protein